MVPEMADEKALLDRYLFMLFRAVSIENYG
jgi:hypothetical protein